MKVEGYLLYYSVGIVSLQLEVRDHICLELHLLEVGEEVSRRHRREVRLLLHREPAVGFRKKVYRVLRCLFSMLRLGFVGRVY